MHSVVLKNLKLTLAYLFLSILVVTLAQHFLSFVPTFPYHQILKQYPELVRPTGYFDGVNYLRIATQGYARGGGEVAFFPLFPLLVTSLSRLTIPPLYSGLLINFMSLVTFIYLLSKYYQKLSTRLLLTLFVFPTGFYLLLSYTESLFLFLTLAFFLLLSKKRYFLSAIVAGLASATKVFGPIFGVILLVDMARRRDFRGKNLLILLVSQLGFLAYSLYLYLDRHDPLAYLHAQEVFAMGRSSGSIVLLPQVLYRYLMMLLTTPISSFIYYRLILELITFTFAVYLLLKNWRSLTLSEQIFSAWAIILPTLSGTLVSFPRYALILLPLFIRFAKYSSHKTFLSYTIVSVITLIINLVMFVQGTFIA